MAELFAEDVPENEALLMKNGRSDLLFVRPSFCRYFLIDVSVMFFRDILLLKARMPSKSTQREMFISADGRLHRFFFR